MSFILNFINFSKSFVQCFYSEFTVSSWISGDYKKYFTVELQTTKLNAYSPNRLEINISLYRNDKWKSFHFNTKWTNWAFIYILCVPLYNNVKLVFLWTWEPSVDIYPSLPHFVPTSTRIAHWVAEFNATLCTVSCFFSKWLYCCWTRMALTASPGGEGRE